MTSISTWVTRKPWRSTLAAASIALTAATAALADPIPPGWTASGFEVVGFTGLQGRPGAFKIVPKQAKNGHWYLYAGHSFDQGWSIVDVTDPSDPKYVRFIPYDTSTHDVLTAQVTLHDDILITAIDKISKVDPAIIIWDISDPENPQRLSNWKGADGGSHRNTYPGGRYAYLSTFAQGYHGRGHEVVILDISDPKSPRQVGVIAQPGQKDGETLPTDHAPGFHLPIQLNLDASN
jgi:hypothetical protein